MDFTTALVLLIGAVITLISAVISYRTAKIQSDKKSIHNQQISDSKRGVFHHLRPSNSCLADMAKSAFFYLGFIASMMPLYLSMKYIGVETLPTLIAMFLMYPIQKYLYDRYMAFSSYIDRVLEQSSN